MCMCTCVYLQRHDLPLMTAISILSLLMRSLSERTVAIMAMWIYESLTQQKFQRVRLLRRHSTDILCSS